MSQTINTVIIEEKMDQNKQKQSQMEMIQTKFNNAISNKNIRQLVSATKLIEAGAHIGLQPAKWNPKMREFIYKKYPNNHVIDILKSLVYLNRAYTFLEETAENGGRVLIVGTTGKALKDLIKKEAARGSTYYVTQRWLGGTLTNFKNISRSIKKLNNYTNLEKTGEIDKYTKKEQINIHREIEKMNKFYEGIKTMFKLPNVLIVIDPVSDRNAILEAKKLNIPVIALANTNTDTDNIDYLIPVNNRSIRSIMLILGVLVDALVSVKNEPTKIVGKPDDQINLGEVSEMKREPRAYTNHRRPYNGVNRRMGGNSFSHPSATGTEGMTQQTGVNGATNSGADKAAEANN